MHKHIRPISLAALTVLEVAPSEAIRIASRCDYTHVGLRPVAATADEPHTPVLTDASLRRELAIVLRGEGVEVLDTEIVRITPTIDWAMMEAVLAFTQEFGATRLLVADNDPEPLRCRNSLARLGELALPYGVTPHLEFMPWTCSPNLFAARERIEGVPNCALLVDAFHLARAGNSPEDIQQGEQTVGYLQLCDISGPVPSNDEILREARSDRLFPGEGDIDLCTLLRRLPDIPVSLEIPADRLRDSGWSAQRRAQRAIDTARTVLEYADRHV